MPASCYGLSVLKDSIRRFCLVGDDVMMTR
jgi:hypothetical protein